MNRIMKVLLLGCISLLVSGPVLAESSLPSDCDYRAIAQALTIAQLQTAYSLSVKCEVALLNQQSESLSEPMLRGQYLATAQILIAQGNFDKARDRMNKANQLSANFLIALDEIEDSTHAFLLERTGSLQEAIQIYYRIATPMSRARLSIIFLDQGNTTAALDAARVALLDSPDEPTAHVVLGNILEKTNPGQALVEYEKALSYVTKGNLSMVPLKYLELPRAKAGIDRLSKLKGGGNL